MSGVRHPLLTIAPAKLRPTQLTVGKAEVAAKRAGWEKLGKKKRQELLASHCFPGVLGPKHRVYIVDHHHLGLALLEEGVKSVPVMIQRDFSWLEPPVFWHTMEFNRWAHPYDQHGNRTDYDAIPTSLTEMADDPYRTLAARVRMAGGCAKDAIPFAEFLWADFYRRNLKLPGGKVTAKALQQALLFAHSHDTAYLPGWSGTIE
ncbi:ParB/Srx family N-terminal domain-containing protein [Rhodanobacter sp. C01]|uniref:ParB-like protein n=1 Tax=Rhodanobacter sp. C01 TaxID=1945856 RepID=UPI0009855B0F|nr:ParB/Srx family N-terminal domain-containing protein [Rhodanobacter sp. C01]OOG48722.1 chromosome partitioning protein ParB [Rhodanobacter sp. C01]